MLQSFSNPFSCIAHSTAAFGDLQENGHSSMYTWILSTGWWKTRAPINPDAVVVVGLLCATLIGGFIYIYRYVFMNKFLSIVKIYEDTHRVVAARVAE